MEIDNLLVAGLTTSDLRWLSRKQYIEHAHEETQPQDAARKFHHCCNLAFSRKTCFVLTEIGAELAASLGAERPAERPAKEAPTAIKLAAVHAEEDKSLPSWDEQRRVLRVGSRIVKAYRVPSPSQEAVLSAFQEEGWPSAILDPLPPAPEQDGKRRLRSTLQSLNSNQKNRLLHFRGDGSGCRVVWELRHGGTTCRLKSHKLERTA